jgi:cystathionine beta-lyase/cystathionine gamma-synthase
MQRQHLPALRPDTLCPQAGQARRDGEPLVTPIVQSTTFCRDGLESTAEHRYSRESNPTVSALEQALGRLEDSGPAVCYASGLAAESGLLMALLRSGDHVVCSRALYGGTTRLLRRVFARFGVESDVVDATDVGAVARALRPGTRLVFVETPANPTLALCDVRRIAELAHAAGALLAVDNTFLTPVLQRPLELGADLSVYSTTKFIEGHSAALGGALVGHDAALLEELRFVRKCTGSIQAPFNAWLTLQGLKTLPLRLRRQSESARAIAEWLAAHPETSVVHYPGLAGFGQAELARAQHLGAHGAVVSFELAGGAAAARSLLRGVKLCRLVEHVGSVESLLTHSASMTHASVPAEERAAVGVSEGLVRLSVGLEEPEDVIADLQQAIAQREVQPCNA